MWIKVFRVNLLMIFVVSAWSAFWSGGIFALLKMTGTLRIDESTEGAGIDAAKHSPPKAYSMGNKVAPA